MKKLIFLLFCLFAFGVSNAQIDNMEYVNVVSNVTHDSGKLYTYVFYDNGKDSAGVKWNLQYPKSIKGGNNYMTGVDYAKYEADNYYTFVYEAKLLDVTIVK